MRIIEQGPNEDTEASLQLFKDHYLELGEIKYVILYYAEREWSVHRGKGIYHQYVIIIGESTQLWLSGLTWGYYGAGPRAFLELIQIIDSTITSEDIAALEWEEDYSPIMYENVNGTLLLKQFDKAAEKMLRNENDLLPWDFRSFIIPELK